MFESLLRAELRNRLRGTSSSTPLFVVSGGAPFTPEGVELVEFSSGGIAVDVALGAALGGRAAGVCLVGEASLRSGLSVLSEEMSRTLHDGLSLPVWVVADRGALTVYSLLDAGGSRVIFAAVEDDVGGGSDFRGPQVVLFTEEPREEEVSAQVSGLAGSTVFIALPGARTTALSAGRAADAAGQSVDVVAVGELPPPEWDDLLDVVSGSDNAVIVSPSGPIEGAARWLAVAIAARTGRQPDVAAGLDVGAVLDLIS
jgi:hypothetical protein